MALLEILPSSLVLCVPPLDPQDLLALPLSFTLCLALPLLLAFRLAPSEIRLVPSSFCLALSLALSLALCLALPPSLTLRLTLSFLKQRAKLAKVLLLRALLLRSNPCDFALRGTLGARVLHLRDAARWPGHHL